jgi:hypothetical protein
VVETKHWEIRFSFVRLRALLRSRERETGESLCFEIFAIQALRCARSGFVIVHGGVIKRSNSCTTSSPLPNLKFPFFSNFRGHFWVFSDLLVWLHCSLFCVFWIPSNLPIPWPSNPAITYEVSSPTPFVIFEEIFELKVVGLFLVDVQVL